MKNIIITGASQGIGYEIVKILAQNSKNKIIAISRNTKNLKKLQKVCLEKYNNKVIIIPADISSILQPKSSLISKITKEVKKIDIIINNAGQLQVSDFEKLTYRNADSIFEVNYFAPAELIRKLMPFLRKAKKAHVVNISSMAGFQSSSKFAGLSHYSASKAAIASLTECLAQEYNNTRISFNALALGAVQTQMLSKAFPDYTAPTTPKKMAAFIADFAVNGNQFFNGKVIPVAITTP